MIVIICAQTAAEIASYHGMILGKLQEVEVSVFDKKYSPVVLSKAAMFALYLTEQYLRFVLQDQMVRFLHLTMDDTKWEEVFRDYSSIPHFRSEISASVLCQNGKTIQVEANICLMKRDDGDWIVSTGVGRDKDSLKFPACRALKKTSVHFRATYDETGKVAKFTVLDDGTIFGEGTSPDDKAMCEVRRRLLTI